MDTCTFGGSVPCSRAPQSWYLSGESAVQQPYHPVAQDGFPMKLSRVEPGQYLDGRPPGKNRLLLEEVLVRGLWTRWSVLVLTPQYSNGDTILSKSMVFRIRR